MTYHIGRLAHARLNMGHAQHHAVTKFGGTHARDHRRDVWKVLRL